MDDFTKYVNRIRAGLSAGASRADIRARLCPKISESDFFLFWHSAQDAERGYGDLKDRAYFSIRPISAAGEFDAR